MGDLSDLDPGQIKQLIGLLEGMLPKEKSSTKKKKPAPKSNKSVTRSKRIVDNERENKFLSMPEMSMHKSDAAIDKKLNKFPPTPRSRGFSLVQVTCRLCGKTEEISPKLAPESIDRYKCNNCSSSEG